MTFDCFLIIFYQDYVPFPIFRVKTYYIFLNWGCMIYACFLYSRMPEGEVSYFKRYANHKKSFNSKKSKSNKKLSTEDWNLRNEKRPLQMSYNLNSRGCSLCLHEKLEIVDDPDDILLNKQ